jgi:signal peptidase
METAITKQPAPLSPARKIIRFAGNLFFGCVLVLMAVLVFFLLQSRLAGGTPAVAGHQLYIVEGGSMRPAFEVGSIILVQPLDPAEVRAGDIITYREPDPEKADLITTHRVMSVSQTEPPSFITRGDANDADDPLPVPAGNLIGRVDYSVPYLGFLFSFVRTEKGILLLIIVPAVLIIASELRKLMRYAHALDKEKQLKGGS